MSYNYSAFPSPIAPDSEKKTLGYGLRVAKASYAPFDVANQYITNRNLRFQENDLFFQGNQPLMPYLKLLDMDGKDSYTNIDYAPTPIVKKYGKIVINGYMNTEEKLNVTSTNKLVNERKDRKRVEAEFRMNEKDFISSVQQESGLELEDPNAFTPESSDELDVWADMNDKEKEEILMQQAIKLCLNNNDFFDVIKENALENAFKKSLAGVYTYLDYNGEIKIKFLRPEDMVYGHSDRKDLKDAQYYGHIERMTISEARVRFGTDEKLLYSVARSCGGIYGNPGLYTDWNNGYYSATVRPYDDFIIKIMHVWYRCVKNINYVKGTTKRGRAVFDIVKGTPNPKESNRTAGIKRTYTAYEGWWYVGTETMAEWGEAKNQVRRDPDLDQVYSPYTLYMWDNDGNMNPTSKVDNIKDSVMQMDLARIKIQQIMAKAAPDGYIIDIDGLYDIDLGKGVGKVSPMQLVAIAQQTGNVFYSSKSTSGDPSNSRKPIDVNQTSFGSKLQELIGVYNFNLNNIRDFLGVNEVREGSGVNPKMGLGVIQEQLAASNNATADLYNGWLNIANRVVTNIGQLIWDSLKYGSDYQGYRRILGKENVEFIREAKDITDSNYDLKIEVKATPYDKQMLEQNITTALSAGLIEMEDAIMIRSIDDIKLSYRYMVVAQKKRKQQRMAEAQQNSEMNAQINERTAVATEQAKQQTIQLQQQLQAQKVAVEAQAKQSLDKRKFLYDVYLETLKMGVELPEEIRVLLDEEFASDEDLEDTIIDQYGSEPSEGPIQ
jgi:hypothetical protein